MNFLKRSNSSYDDVEWLDTDASEDEDYLPQFSLQQPVLPSTKTYFSKQDQQLHHFDQISGSSFDSQSSIDTVLDHECCMNTGWDINKRRISVADSETPCDKVRRAVDKTIDDGIEKVDISNVKLTEIPDEITELQYVTVVHNDIVKTASLQIYLYGNELACLNPCLFQLKNLSVLSLRNNRLTFIPPEISLLHNLVELSLGNNQLKYIPAELLRLKKLSILSLLPNPFLPLEQQQHRQRKQTRRASLTEISTRIILQQEENQDAVVLPADIMSRFQSLSPEVHYCEQCQLKFHVPDVEEMVWKTVLRNRHVPVLYRFCSVRCSNIHTAALALTTDPTFTNPA